MSDSERLDRLQKALDAAQAGEWVVGFVSLASHGVPAGGFHKPTCDFIALAHNEMQWLIDQARKAGEWQPIDPAASVWANVWPDGAVFGAWCAGTWYTAAPPWPHGFPATHWTDHALPAPPQESGR